MIKRQSRNTKQPHRTKNRRSRVRLNAICRFCERRFKNVQAVRAHLKACPVYQVTKSLREQPKGTSTALGRLPTQVDSGLNPQYAQSEEQNGSVQAKATRRRPGRDSQDSLLCLLDTHEIFQSVLEDVKGYCRYVRFAASARPVDHAGFFNDWAALYTDLLQCERDCGQMVLRMRLDPDLLSGLYRNILRLKALWLSYRSQDLHPADSEDTCSSVASIQRQFEEEKALWESLLNKLKRMYVACV